MVVIIYWDIDYWRRVSGFEHSEHKMPMRSSTGEICRPWDTQVWSSEERFELCISI